MSSDGPAPNRAASAANEAAPSRTARLRAVLRRAFAFQVAKLEVALRRAAFLSLAATLGIVAVIALLVTAIVLIATGLAGWFGSLMSSPHGGSVVAGLLVLLLIAGALFIVGTMLAKRKATIQRLRGEAPDDDAGGGDEDRHGPSA